MRTARALIGALLLLSCGPRIIEEPVHRSACEVCHRPLNNDGEPEGIEDAHPWYSLSCTDCHGGKARVCSGPVFKECPNLPEDDDCYLVCDGQWEYDQEKSHVSPGTGPKDIRRLTSKQLDALDPNYVRFINPGDYRVARTTCGGGSLGQQGSGCHQSAVDTAVRSTMAHTSGEVAVARFRAGKQDKPTAVYGAISLLDPDYQPDDLCASEAIQKFDPKPIDLLSTLDDNAPTVANAQDQYMVKSCFRCHLWDFGENSYPGDFRSSGCTGCHMVYADDGFSKSLDPWVNKQTVPHPVQHKLTRSPPITQCTHCHYRGGRIGISYQGYRERGGKGLNPEKPDDLGVPIHNHDATYYLTDENTENDWDETPADVHFDAGMHCVDCHTKLDVHGDGHLYGDTQCAVDTYCTDCHGTVREYAKPDLQKRPNFYEENGTFYLRTRVTDKLLKVTQTKDTVTPGKPGHSWIAEQVMGVNEQGFSHTDVMECYTCHASWLPSCYGCHVTVDLSREAKYHTTGALVKGKPGGKRRWVVLNDLVLMKNTEGKIAPSMPAERLFMNLEIPDPTGAGATKFLFKKKPRARTLADGRTIAAFGQRAFNPHTTRSRSQFMACDRCHSVGSVEAPENRALLDLTFGFGTRRLPEYACDVTNEDESCDEPEDYTTYQLDRIQTREGEPLVVVGHPVPQVSRPLTLEEIDRMKKVLVPEWAPFKTTLPNEALCCCTDESCKPFTEECAPEKVALCDWRWPQNQKIK